MTLKLKDWTYSYFGSTDKAIKFVNDFFEKFKVMPKLLETDLSKEEYMMIVNLFYEINDIKGENKEEIYIFLKKELTEKRVRKDIFTTRNRINKAIEYVRIWYLSKEIEETRKRLTTLEEYESTFDSNIETLNNISENLARKKKKSS